VLANCQPILRLRIVQIVMYSETRWATGESPSLAHTVDWDARSSNFVVGSWHLGSESALTCCARDDFEEKMLGPVDMRRNQAIPDAERPEHKRQYSMPIRSFCNKTATDVDMLYAKSRLFREESAFFLTMQEDRELNLACAIHERLLYRVDE
jgi:hypothetical protein